MDAICKNVICKTCAKLHPLRGFPYVFQIPKKEGRAYICSESNWYKSLKRIKDVVRLVFCIVVNKE